MEPVLACVHFRVSVRTPLPHQPWSWSKIRCSTSCWELGEGQRGFWKHFNRFLGLLWAGFSPKPATLPHQTFNPEQSYFLPLLGAPFAVLKNMKNANGEFPENGLFSVLYLYTTYTEIGRLELCIYWLTHQKITQNLLRVRHLGWDSSPWPGSIYSQNHQLDSDTKNKSCVCSCNSFCRTLDCHSLLR